MELTAEEKINIIEQHQRNIAYNKYNSQVSLVEENAKATPDSSIIANLNVKITEATAQLAALQDEIDALS
jgi:hypothetical protein